MSETKRFVLDKGKIQQKPELEILDRIFCVDNRVNTVKKMAKIKSEGVEEDEYEQAVLRLLLGADAATEIAAMNLPLPAYLEMFEGVTSLATGEDPEEIRDRFQKANKEA